MSFAGKKKGGFALGGSTAPAKQQVKAAVRSAAPVKGKGKARAIEQDDDDDDDDLEHDDDEVFDDGDDSEDEEEDDDDFGGLEPEDGDDPDTDEEIEAAKTSAGKSSRTAKRKRRATSPGAFGATLQSLLGGGPDADEDDDDDGELSSAAADNDDDEEEEEEDEADAGPHKKKQRTVQRGAAGSLTTATTGTLGASRPSAILSMAPHLRRTLTSQKLNAKAARLAIQQRKMREERAHIVDVIGGWGPPGVLPVVDEKAWMSQLAAKKKAQQQQQQAANGGGGALVSFGKKRNWMGGSAGVDEEDGQQRAWLEEGGSRAYERKLRKVAQRGVVKLFNAIRAAQTTSLDDVQAATASGGAGGDAVTKKAMPGGKEAALSNLSKNNFLDLIRSGSDKAK